MKLILDIDDKMMSEIMSFCEKNETTPSGLFSELFNTYIHEPSYYLNKLIIEGKSRNFEEFTRLLLRYLNESIYDIEESANSEEAYETDKDMVRVFKVLTRDYINNPYLITNLYKVYIEGD